MRNFLFSAVVVFSVFNSGFCGELRDVNIKNAPAAIPSPADRAYGGFSALYNPEKITGLHLLPNCGNNKLMGFADTAEEFKAAAAVWKKVLAEAGIKITGITFEGGAYTISYRSADGRILRSFIADSRQFPPKNETLLKENMAMISGKMKDSGLAVIAAYIADVKDVMPPTYYLYYLTKPVQNTYREIQARILAPQMDIDFDMLEKTNIKIIQKPGSFLMVYIGSGIGAIAKFAKTQSDIERKIQEHRKFLETYGMEYIGSKIISITEDPPLDYKYMAKIYFFQ